jgi:hypothetical protein
MATENYMIGRKRYARPQGILWSENPGTLINGVYVPVGYEINSDTGSEPNTSLFNQFLVLSDHNRSEMQFQPERIETRQRMINGRMRSYHVADKQTMSVSWNLLPSRSYSETPNFNANAIPSYYSNSESSFTKLDNEYTADGGAGGVELLDWYENHKGSFWMFLAYDKYNEFTDDKYDKLGQYNDVVEVFISSFDYSVAKRGSTNHDLWNVSVTLEEA